MRDRYATAAPRNHRNYRHCRDRKSCKDRKGYRGPCPPVLRPVLRDAQDLWDLAHLWGPRTPRDL
ncbi:hypothetical protein SSP35_03_05090 [Streptomyces sp. NBRC 110611]|nr:hypothetical protein SSP35_03_05090 [Streptomyces sp. NBRC 110611]